MKIAVKVIMSAFLAVAFVPSVLLAAGTETTPSAQKSQDLPDVLDRVTSSSSSKDQEEGDAITNSVPSSVEKVVKNLSTQAKGLTLEDLNSAREASAKLDALLDIERKLTDLAKLRQDRDTAINAGNIEANSGKFEASIPMSALAEPQPVVAPPAYLAPAAPAPAPAPVPVNEGPKEVDIIRVSGASGKYVAIYKGANEEELKVRQGDKMQDDSVVRSISRHGVTLAKNKKTVTLQIKGISNVFGAE